jgi:hypothetical protein
MGFAFIYQKKKGFAFDVILCELGGTNIQCALHC